MATSTTAIVSKLSKALRLDNMLCGSLTNPYFVFTLQEKLRLLETLGKQYNTTNDSILVGGSFYASQSGLAISTRFNGVHRGGSYEGSMYYLVQIAVGGGIDMAAHNALLEVAKRLLSKYSYQSHMGEAKVLETSGANWSSVLLTAPNNSTGVNTISC